MDAEGEQHGPAIELDRVLATYQHVREQWGLKNTDTARMKAKRAGWAQLPKNSPGEVTRLIIPREQWDAAGSQSRGTGGDAPGEQHWVSNSGGKRRNGPLPTDASAAPEMAIGIAAILTKLAEREAAELHDARALANQLAGEVAELRERVGRAEAERDRADQRARELEEGKRQPRVALRERRLPAEVVGMTDEAETTEPLGAGSYDGRKSAVR